MRCNIKLTGVCVVCWIFLMGCQVDGYIGELHGNWQLKKVDYPDGTVENLDSIFYSFQGDVVFLQSFYKLAEGDAYGYSTKTDQNILLQLKKGNLNFSIYRMPALDCNYKIEKLEFKKMILNYNDTIFTFHRYAW